MAVNKELCIKLVETIEMFPCLYDYNSEEYCNERVKSNACGYWLTKKFVVRSMSSIFVFHIYATPVCHRHTALVDWYAFRCTLFVAFTLECFLTTPLPHYL